MAGEKARQLEDLTILLAGVPARSDRGWLGYCTVALLRLDGGWALFDTGHYSDRTQLLDALKSVDVKPAEIKHIILSHLHFDHVLNLPLFPNASIVISRAELDYAEQVVGGAVDDPSIVDFWPSLLKDRQVLRVEDSLLLSGSMEVVRLPGHTPGCLALFLGGSSRAAVCGDVIKNAWEAVNRAPTPPAARSDAGRESIEYVLKRAQTIVPGHDRPFIVRGRTIEYLTPFAWKVHGHFFPHPQNRLLLDLALPAGLCSVEEHEPADAGRCGDMTRDGESSIEVNQNS